MAAWQIKQLEKMSAIDPSVIDDVIHHFQASDPARLEKLVIGAYLDRDINLGKAAELLDVHREELRRRFLKKGIPIHEGSQTIEELKAEIAAAIAMRPSE
ncbi:MAG: putative HTH domain antitoxin [Candidatus Latescibacterota bacterium]|jgi:predicted HTH domain antitoxin